MAKTKAELLNEAKKLGLKIDPKLKISEIRTLLESSQPSTDSEESKSANEAKAKPVSTAKAGKRSAKSIAEAEQKQEKEEQKSKNEVKETVKAKPAAPPTRPRVERRGKLFRAKAELIEAGKNYPLDEAASLAKKTSHVKFDATVELHVNLGVDPKHADQNIRDSVALPAGTGKTIRIAVLSDDAAAAKKAGADLVDNDEITSALEKGIINFDVLITTPAQMPKLSKYARILGPRGLMPNPKSGTVTTDLVKAISEAKSGRVEYRVDSSGIVHLGVGKVSFSELQISDNLKAVLDSIKSNKPGSVKGNYLKSIHVTTSMGPSIHVDISSIG